MQDFSRIAAGLERHADGIWYARRREAVDYPDEGNAFCYQVEDGSFWFRHRNEAIIAVVRRFPPGGWIADIGAGNGFVTSALNGAGFPAVAIEPGASGARNSVARGIATVICSTVEAAEFQPHTIPAAGLFDVLEHIADDVAFLRDLRQLLVRGAPVYVTVPAHSALWSSEDQLVGHHRRYTRRQLTNSFDRAGYQVEFASYLFRPLPPAILLLKALPSRLGIRRSLDADKIARELRPPDSTLSRALEKLLKREVRTLESGGRIAFGSTCLAVGRAR